MSNNSDVFETKISTWFGYIFTVLTMEEACKRSDAGVFIFATELKEKESVSWMPCFISETNNFKNLQSNPWWLEAQKIGGATHVHILCVTEEKHRKFYAQSVINSFGYGHIPFINKLIQSEEQPFPSLPPSTLSIFGETNSKLELLYQYEKHYLELIKDYKEEIKFANALQEDLRRERSHFFAQTLKDVIQTMKSEEIDKNVSATWIQELVASYTKSIDLSSDLAKTHVIEILSILTEEAKREASKAKLDNFSTETKSDNTSKKLDA
jgi:hypothetical protein